MSELIEPHEPLPDCDCHECAIVERNWLRRERDALQARLDMWIRDYNVNREISRGQARRIRELLSRLGEPCAPDIGLPPDEVGPLRADAARYRWLRETSVHSRAFGRAYWGDELDAAIDVALTAKVER